MILSDAYSIPFDDISALKSKSEGQIKTMNAKSELGELSKKEQKELYAKIIIGYRRELRSILLDLKWGSNINLKTQQSQRQQSRRYRRDLRLRGPTRVY
jgi:hypothetical protein